MNLYDPKCWKDYGNYYIYDVPQRSIAWHLVRVGRPSGSTIGYCLGHSIFGDSTQSALDICCMQINFDPDGTVNKQQPIALGKKEKSEASKRVIQLGIDNEDIARKWYSESHNCLCDEVGYAVPKFDNRIGVSIDGDVRNLDGSPTDGIIEIKCPQKLYRPPKQRLMREAFVNKFANVTEEKKGDKTYIKDYNHIWQTHYDQMQMGMAIMDKKWCDYVVYGLDNQWHVERIPFDKDYWKECYDQIKIFIDGTLNYYLSFLNKIDTGIVLEHGLKLKVNPGTIIESLTFPLMPI